MKQRATPIAYKLKITLLGILTIYTALTLTTGCKQDYYSDYQASPNEIAAFKKGASDYLKSKYKQKMKLLENAQYTGKPFYSFEIKAHPANNKKLVFSVWRSNEAEIDSPEWTYPDYQDDYPDLFWESQAKKELEPIVKRLLSKDAYIEEVDVQDTNLWDEKKQMVVPSYREIRDKKVLEAYTDGEVLTRLYIKVPKTVNQADIKAESKQIFALISYLNIQKIEIDSFQVVYSSGLTIDVGNGRRLSHVVNLKRLAEFIK